MTTINKASLTIVLIIAGLLLTNFGLFWIGYRIGYQDAQQAAPPYQERKP